MLWNAEFHIWKIDVRINIRIINFSCRFMIWLQRQQDKNAVGCGRKWFLPHLIICQMWVKNGCFSLTSDRCKRSKACCISSLYITTLIKFQRRIRDFWCPIKFTISYCVFGKVAHYFINDYSHWGQEWIRVFRTDVLTFGSISPWNLD